MAHDDVLVHALAAQVEVAVAQAEDSSTSVSSLMWKGGVLAGLRTSASVAATSISPVGRSAFSVPGGAGDGAAYEEDVLAAASSATAWARRRPGVEDDLDEAGVVPEVDEDEAAVVAAAVHPAGERDGLPRRRCAVRRRSGL